MKDEFIEYGNKMPRMTFKSFVRQLTIWGALGLLILLGLLMNGKI